MLRFFLIISLSFGVLLIGVGVFWQNNVLGYLQSPMNTKQEPFFYNFKSGRTLNNLVHDLSAKGTLDNPDYLLWYTKLEGKKNTLKSGTYRVDPKKQSALDLLEMLQKGSVADFSFRTQEGHTFKKMIKRVRKNKDLIHQLKSFNAKEVMVAIGQGGKPFEGFFYPDTYLLPHGFSDIDFLKHSYDLMNTLLEKEWANRAKGLVLKTKHEALILASIIEKETANYDERFLISGVFHNRLKKKMRLQTDPTVIYGMGDRYKGNLTKKDLRTKTAYNTYKIKGLPPTPISMPSRESINAALHPAKTSALFFVAMNRKRHYFSATYAEHKRAVQRYQIASYKKRLLEKKQDLIKTLGLHSK